MTTATRSRKTHKGPSQATQDRQAEIELLTEQVNDEAPDYAAFRARWENRYGEANLNRLWVQCPQATALHRFSTWRGMGRQVRKGEHAIYLRIPHTGYDESKVTEANPDGRVFHGAPWMALFDFSQTDPIGDFEDGRASTTCPDALAQVRRLRMAAVQLHPDMTGDPGTTQAFMAAWAAYEAAKARLG